MKTNYLIDDFDSLNLPQSPSYELACAICDDTQFEDWLPLIESLCCANHLALTATKRMSTGENPVFELESVSGELFYLKFIAPNWLFQYHNECEALTTCITANLPVKTPTLRLHGEINGWGYLLTTALEGELLADIYNELTLEQRVSIAAQLGRFCLQMHSVPMQKDSCLYVDWPAFIEKQYHNSYARRKRQGLRADMLADFIPYIAHTPYQPPTTHQLHLLHTDLHPGNLLVTRDGGCIKLSGVFDFGDALVCSEPRFELTTIGLLIAQGEQAVFQAFLESYLYQIEDKQGFINCLMTLTLLRHTGSLNYIIEHVPNVKACTNWKEAEPYLFPI